MNRFLSIFGMAIPVLVLVFAIFYGLIVYKGSGVDEESEKFVNEAMPVILKAMNRQTFFRYADSSLISSAKADRFDHIFEWFGMLGEMNEYKGSSGKANVKMGLSGITFTAEYEARASFEKGDAVITVTAVRRGDSWKISGFGISSPVLTQTSNENLYKL